VYRSRAWRGKQVCAGLATPLRLADYLKQFLLRQSPDLPPDLCEQAQGSPLFAQFSPGAANWLCRRAELPDTALTFAFEQD
jgi:hypothetical protein